MRAWLLAVLVLAGACKSSDTESTSESQPSSPPQPLVEPAAANANTGSEPAVAVPLRFKVNDKHVEVEHLGGDFALLDVKELPPINQWKTLIVRNVEGREFTGTKPILLTGSRTMRVVTLASGACEFRVIEPNPETQDGDAPKTRIRHKMTKVKSIIIHTKDYEPPAPPAPVSVLLVKSGDAEAKLDRKTMDAIERNPEPGDREARDTWTLATLRDASRLESKASIRLTDGMGKTIDILSEELADTSSAHMIKRNRRGLFNYRRWSVGPPPKRVGEMRGVVSMELL